MRSILLLPVYLTGLYVVRLGLGGYDSGHLPDRTSTLNDMFSALLICYF